MSLHVSIQIKDGPLGPTDALTADGAGAVCRFEGVVRGEEDSRTICGLHYEAYQPMAGVQLQRLEDEAMTRFGLLAIAVEHSVGWVPAGACSFRLQVASRHRKEALAAMDWFIDALKRDVPIWKSTADDLQPTATPAEGGGVA